MNSVSLPVALMSAIVFYVGLYRLFFYFTQKENKLNLYFAFVCFSVGLYEVACAGLYNASSVTSGVFWQKCQYFTGQAIAVSFVFFTYDLTNRKRDWIFRAYCLTMAGMFILGLLFNDSILSIDAPIVRQVGTFFFNVTYYEASPGLLMSLLFIFLLAGISYTFLLLLHFLSQNRRKDLWPLVIAFCVFYISAVMDILIGSEFVSFIYTAEYSFLIVVVMMDYALLRHFVGLFQKIEDMNVRLEEKVADRTLEIQNMANEVLLMNKQLEEKNAMLAELVERDGLTRLYNHAAFQEKLGEVLNLSKRKTFQFCVAMMDIDWFKKINDQYGHIIGDQVLQKVAEVLSWGPDQAVQERRPSSAIHPNLRNYDIAARYGGDEFALLLSGCGGKEIKIIADRISQTVRELVIDACPDLHLTLSIGIVVVDDTSLCPDGKTIIQIADRALYFAKEQGRNRSIIIACSKQSG